MGFPIEVTKKERNRQQHIRPQLWKRANRSIALHSPDDLHHDLMELFVATIGRGYVTQRELCRASENFWQWNSPFYGIEDQGRHARTGERIGVRSAIEL